MRRFPFIALAALVLAACQDSTQPKVETPVRAITTATPAATTTFAYVTNRISNTVSVINTGSNTVVATVPVGNPIGVAITPDGAFAYVTNGNASTVSVIETASNTVVAPTVRVGTSPVGVAITPDGAFAYVTNRTSNTVSVIETASPKRVVATVGVGLGPFGVSITPDGAFAYVTNTFSNTVSVIATTNNMVVATVAVGSPSGVAITPDGAFVYATNQLSSSVSVIETAGNTVVATVGVGTRPTLVAITPPLPVRENPLERIDLLIADVQALIDANVLDLEGNGLLGILGAARASVQTDRPSSVAQLNAFINAVEGFISGGLLTAEQGQPLIDAAQSIIDQLSP